MTKTDVLIVGAGPTGLVLALWLTRLGARVHIVDKSAEPGQTSRAIGVQARTLEQYRQVDLARDVVNGGFPAAGLNFWVKGERKARLELGEMGTGLSPYPYLLAYAQDEHEKLLVSRLSKLGVEVQRETELVHLTSRDDRVTARLLRADGALDEYEASYVAGCDGARSFVRDAVKVNYFGGTYSHLFYVADVEASGPTMDGEAHFALEDDGTLLACIALGPSQARLIGTVRKESVNGDKELGWADVSKRVIERLSLRVERVHWFSTYRVHHRVASSFRVGRVFLVGDAAHIHSPVGGQGMNTGIGDAVNLAWKIASALHGHADDRLVESYERERMPFARRLVHSTDRLFELLSADGPVATKLRLGITPQLVTTLAHSEAIRRFLFRTISQINVNYRDSWLSEGHVGHVHGGDRLPWIELEDSHDNFEPLTSLGWQMHVYGNATDYLASACSARHLPLRVFAWNENAEKTGLKRNTTCLVRPDGYVALASSASGAAERLGQYLATRNIRLGAEGMV